MLQPGYPADEDRSIGRKITGTEICPVMMRSKVKHWIVSNYQHRSIYIQSSFIFIFIIFILVIIIVFFIIIVIIIVLQVLNATGILSSVTRRLLLGGGRWRGGRLAAPARGVERRPRVGQYRVTAPKGGIEGAQTVAELLMHMNYANVKKH